MSLCNINNSSGTICAFCKNWNDRQDTHIKYKTFNFWEYDNQAKEYCSVRKVKTIAIDRCRYFKPKLY